MEGLGYFRSPLPEPLEHVVDALARADDHDHNHQLVVSHLIDDPVLNTDAADVNAPVNGVLAL